MQMGGAFCILHFYFAFCILSFAFCILHFFIFHFAFCTLHWSKMSLEKLFVQECAEADGWCKCIPGNSADCKFD